MTDQQELIKRAFAFLREGDHEVIIFGAIKRLHVTIGNPLYDDLVQEGRLAFIKKFLQAIELEKSAAEYLAFINQGVYWELANYMKKLKTHNDHFYVPAQTDEDEDPFVSLVDEQNTEYVDLRAFVETILQFCTPNEASYLKYVFYQGINVTEISQKMGVSRQTIYKWRKNISAKVVDLI